MSIFKDSNRLVIGDSNSNAPSKDPFVALMNKYSVSFLSKMLFFPPLLNFDSDFWISFCVDKRVGVPTGDCEQRSAASHWPYTRFCEQMAITSALALLQDHNRQRAHRQMQLLQQVLSHGRLRAVHAAKRPLPVLSPSQRSLNLFDMYITFIFSKLKLIFVFQILLDHTAKEKNKH